MFAKLKSMLKKFLETVAKQNETLYGKDRLDCCNLNKPKKR
ncbi:LDCC motif putative metal-binding protein [Cellulosilyticum sp. I15G10I2]|nr:LDCC motif putative metal-binding protein [Cellulosilyticum sp. I15G10I2]